MGNNHSSILNIENKIQGYNSAKEGNSKNIELNNKIKVRHLF